jgi:hypothetical protein
MALKEATGNMSLASQKEPEDPDVPVEACKTPGTRIISKTDMRPWAQNLLGTQGQKKLFLTSNPYLGHTSCSIKQYVFRNSHLLAVWTRTSHLLSLSPLPHLQKGLVKRL